MDLHILLVDRDPDFARLLGGELTNRMPSLVSRIACRASEALDLLAREPFHVAVCSTDLPDMEALAFLERLRTVLSVPAILFFLLPRWDAEVAARAQALGARGVFEKPRRPQELLNILCRALCGEPAILPPAEFFRRLVENVPDVLYFLRLRPRPTCEYISPIVAAFTGHVPDDYTADPNHVYQGMPPEDRARFEQLLAHPEPPASPVVLRWQRKDGRTLWVEHRFSALRGTNGTVEAWEGIARDVTQRHRLEICQAAVYEATAELSEAAGVEEAAPHVLELLGTSLESSAGALWLPGGKGGPAELVHFWSDLLDRFPRLQAAARTGIPAESAGTDPEWIPDLRIRPDLPYASAAVQEELRAAVRTPIPVGPVAAGALAFFTREAAPPDPGLLGLLGSLGRQIGLFVLRRRAEEALHRLNETLERRVRERTRELEEALEDVSTFAYTVAHDLRAPLRAMAGFSQTLLEDYTAGLDPAGQECARRIAEASRRMDGLLQDLLSYVRLTQADLTARPERLDEALDGALADLSEEIARRRADIVVERPLGVVLAHGPTLRLVIAQIVSNAVKFVAPQTAPRIRVRAEPRSGFIRLWVQDNGIGIPPEYHGRIFGVFERLHRLEEYPGTGIGLALVRKAVERMQGRCGVESRSGAGSRFWIELPAAP